MKIIGYKINDIRDKLYHLLLHKFSKEGFEFKKTNSWFIRGKGTCDHILYLLLHARADHYAVEVFLFIRQKQVEKLLKKILHSSTGLTIGNTIGVIYNSPNGRTVVNNLMEILLIEDMDIDAAVETIGQYYDNIAKLYFEKYSNLNELDKIINNPPFDYCPAHVGGTLDDRCMRGLIIARLINSDNYAALESVYDNVIMTTMNQQSIDDYDKIKEYLMRIRI